MSLYLSWSIRSEEKADLRVIKCGIWVGPGYYDGTVGQAGGRGRVKML